MIRGRGCRDARLYGRRRGSCPGGLPRPAGWRVTDAIRALTRLEGAAASRRGGLSTAPAIVRGACGAAGKIAGEVGRPPVRIRTAVLSVYQVRSLEASFDTSDSTLSRIEISVREIDLEMETWMQGARIAAEPP